VSNKKHILAIDLGTSGPKVALFNMQGDLLVSAFEETPAQLLPHGGAEQAPSDWRDAIDRATRRVLAQSQIEAKTISAIGVTAQWSGTVAVDESGAALGNAILWMDSRGAPYIHQMAQGFPTVEGYGLGKILNWIRLTGGAPSNTGKDSIAHILYLKHERAEIYNNAYKFLEPVDYLGLALTGKFAASYNSITLHWVTDNRDIENVTYHDGLLKLVGIDRAKLPDLLPANAPLGTLQKEIARDWGLSEDTQVFVGSPDLHSAAVGSGAVKDYEPHLYIGTSSWLVCHVPFKKTDLFHNMASLPSGIPGRYLLTNEQESAGACLQYLRDQIFFPQDALTQTEKPQNVYALFDELAASVPAGSDNLIFMPWLYGERTPVDDHLARGGFFNVSLNSTRAHFIRAALEGVAYNARWLLSYVEQFTRRPAESIRMVGGGAQSDLWCQICADVLNRPIHQVANPLEVNVRGAALLAVAALGELRYDEIGSHVKIARTYTPNPQHRKTYDELFKVFVGLYEKNQKTFAKLNE